MHTSGQLICTFQSYVATCLQFIPNDSDSNNNILATTSDHYSSSISLWKPKLTAKESWSAVQTLRGHRANVNTLKFSTDGKRMASLDMWYDVITWCVQSGEKLSKFNLSERSPIPYHKPITAWSSDIKTFAMVTMAEGPDIIFVFDSESGKMLFEPLDSHSARVEHIAMCANATFLAAVTKNTAITIWNLRHTEESGSNAATVRHVLRGHTGAITSICLSSDNKHMISAGDDRTMRIWGVDSGQQVRMF